jgi:quercetin dioxygenase-like cupin family protein
MSDNDKIEQLEKKLLWLPQIELPLTHLFAPGVYYREIFMPEGSFIIGHEHLTEHFNIVLSGVATVYLGGGRVDLISGPTTFISKPGVRKMLYIHMDMRWVTIHPTNVTDVSQLESMLIVKSEEFCKHELELAEFKKILGGTH